MSPTNENKIEEILKSLEGLKRACAPAFLYGKIQTRLNADREYFFEKKSFFLIRPIIIASTLGVILLSDVIALESHSNRTTVESDDTGYNILLDDNPDDSVLYDL